MQLQDDAAEPDKFVGIGGIFVKTILFNLVLVLAYGSTGLWYNSTYVNETGINLPNDHW